MPSPFISVICFREEGAIFFPSRAKEAKKQKKNNAWSQVNVIDENRFHQVNQQQQKKTF